jgi:hypothetical protein
MLGASYLAIRRKRAVNRDFLAQAASKGANWRIHPAANPLKGTPKIKRLAHLDPKV